MFEDWDKADRVPIDGLIKIVLTVAQEMAQGGWHEKVQQWSETDTNASNWETLNAGLYGVTNPPEYVYMKQMMQDASRKRLEALELNCKMFAKFFRLFRINGKKEEFIKWYTTIQNSINSVGKKAMRSATLHITEDYREDAFEFILELFDFMEELHSKNLTFKNYYTKIGIHLNHIKILRIPLRISDASLTDYDIKCLKFQIRSYLAEEKKKEKILIISFRAIKRAEPIDVVKLFSLSLIHPDQAIKLLDFNNSQ